ncbi:hypothetical protein M0802_016936 [Mischocyttarus mexicanus]|nr:hypothetical protein M0802_017004 [Mischocyttarus mexicanus]KAI4472326.1 hypothetical protein M0802_016936 [Mischocyttarus mexicanus]
MVQGDDGGDVDGGSGGKMAMVVVVVVMVFGERGGLTGYRQMFFPFVLQAATHGAPTLSLFLSLSFSLSLFIAVLYKLRNIHACRAFVAREGIDSIEARERKRTAANLFSLSIDRGIFFSFPYEEKPS